jgi:hypothetical protein
LGNKFDHELSKWCKELDLIISDIDVLGRDNSTFTYVSDAHHIVLGWTMLYVATAWINIYFKSKCVINHLVLIIYHYLYVLALILPLSGTSIHKAQIIRNDKKSLMFKWCDATDEQILNDKFHSMFYLKNIIIPVIKYFNKIILNLES